MKVPLEWLREYVPIRLTPERLAERLTMAGLEVTAIERLEGEPVFSVEITPNRPDCLSIIGIAREVAAITGQRLKLPTCGVRSAACGVNMKRTQFRIPHSTFRIHIEDRQGCRRYLGRLIENLAIGPSPTWMQKRLVTCGLRPLNNVVDITNYVLLECGQPLHAFDYDRLVDGTIIVRRAKAGETMLTIDGKSRTLSPEMLVIADARRPVAVAGVMGGRDTEVTQSTKRILLESAWFDPIMVRRTGRALGLSSESSYRFERGVDPQGVEAASCRAAALIVQLVGGHDTVFKPVGGQTIAPRIVSLEVSRLRGRLGIPLQSAKIKQLLQRLGFTVQTTQKRVRVRVPSFRLDIKQDVDLIEEVARLYGYDRLPKTLPQVPLVTSHDDHHFTRVQELRQLCVSLGLWELVTWALVAETELARIGLAPPQGGLRLANPLSRDHAILRPTVLIGMLQAVAKNLTHGALGVRCFELGNVFEASPSPHERLQLGIGIAGLWERNWQGQREVNLFVLKGLIEQLVERIVRQPLEVKAISCPWAEPGQSMQLLLAHQPLGVLGQVARRISEVFGLEKPVWFGELSVDTLLQSVRASTSISAPSPFPPVKRDLSFLVDKQIACAKLLERIRTMGTPLINRVELIDRYTSPQIPDTKHSLTFSIEYRDPSRTLTAAEVDQRHQQIGHELVQRFGAQLR